MVKNDFSFLTFFKIKRPVKSWVGLVVCLRVKNERRII